MGVEELVVKDARGLSGTVRTEDPLLLGVQIGLRRTALDDIAQGFLPAVGLGKIVLVEEEKGDGQANSDGDDGNHEPVKADAGGLDGDDLAVAVEHAESDQS